MARLVDAEELEEVIAFARAAALRFAQDNLRISTYTTGDIEAGCWFALRWGLHDRAVMVFKLDEYVEPLIFGDLIPITTKKVPNP